MRSVVDAGDHVLVDGEPTRHLVAADGLHSPIRRMLGLEAPAGHRPQVRPARARRRSPPWSGFVEVHWSRVGEVYVTPVADGLVGIAVLTDRRATFAELLSAFPTLAPHLDGHPMTRVRGAGPLRQRSTRRVQGRVLLVGDSAGYVDALTGEGIAIGIAQARAAVAAIADGRAGRYERDWRRVTRRHDLLTQGLLDRHPAPRAAHPDRAGRRGAAVGVRRRREPAREAGMSGGPSRWCCSTRTGSRRGRRQGDRAPSRDPAAPGVLLLRPTTPTAGCWSPAGPSTSRPGRARGPTACAATRPRARTSPTPCAGARARSSGCGCRRWPWSLPAFRYRAVMADGTVENEMCPVFVATTADAVRPDADEVDDFAWVPWPEFRTSVLSGERDVSPWCVEQLQALPEDPWRQATLEPAAPAARYRTSASGTVTDRRG